MTVILKKSVDDGFFGGCDYDYLSMNKLNKAITQCYLPTLTPSPLKELLLKRLGTVKQLYLYLRVSFVEDTNIVKSIQLCYDLKNDCDRASDRWGIDEVNRESITNCMTSYFINIGYSKLKCTTNEDIIYFVHRLGKDIPIVADYFEIIDKLNNGRK